MKRTDEQFFVGPFVCKHEWESTINKEKFNNVFVKDLSKGMIEEDLTRIFGELGPITSVVVMKDGDGKSKCFGFFNFENVDDAVMFVEALNGQEFDDKEWYIGKAKKKKKSDKEVELKKSIWTEYVERHEFLIFEDCTYKPKTLLVNLYQHLEDKAYSWAHFCFLTWPPKVLAKPSRVSIKVLNSCLPMNPTCMWSACTDTRPFLFQFSNLLLSFLHIQVTVHFLFAPSFIFHTKCTTFNLSLHDKLTTIFNLSPTPYPALIASSTRILHTH